METSFNSQGPARPNSSELRFRGALDTVNTAEYTGFARATLKKWRATGDGPPYVRVGSKIVYRPADLDAWLEDHLVGGGHR